MIGKKPGPRLKLCSGSSTNSPCGRIADDVIRDHMAERVKGVCAQGLLAGNEDDEGLPIIRMRRGLRQRDSVVRTSRIRIRDAFWVSNLLEDFDQHPNPLPHIPPAQCQIPIPTTRNICFCFGTQCGQIFRIFHNSFDILTIRILPAIQNILIIINNRHTRKPLLLCKPYEARGDFPILAVTCA